ncbi:DUF3558 domain-containing protein [Amycolatopsis sp. NBC_01488]|uniref:DUF3558 domain-containing protein n=1 Tax=Amycolatopsis sp. NBC_01488 TaxID=2903563 RepID=UPI002E2D9176|nr:DUF3558 domain-containing protein [Amycolatopsis sp. NBC_01488]
MRSKLIVLAVFVAVPAALLAGCTSTTGGAASPAPSASAAAGTSSADPDVPKVAHPLDAGKYATDPCGLVPKDLLATLRYTDAGEPHQAGDTPLTKAGPSCAWKIQGEGIGAQVILGTGNRDNGAGGLAGQYAAYRSGKVVRFLERAPDVEGYPAIYFDAADERSMGTCTMAVGIADDLSFSVQAQGYQGQDDSCGTATQLSAAVIKTLQGA